MLVKPLGMHGYGHYRLRAPAISVDLSSHHRLPGLLSVGVLLSANLRTLFMAGKPKKAKFKPSEGDSVAGGIPTVSVDLRGEQVVEYLTSKKARSSSSLVDGNLEPLPSLHPLLQEAASSSCNSHEPATQENVKGPKVCRCKSPDCALDAEVLQAPHQHTEEFLSGWGQSFLDIMHQREASDMPEDKCGICGNLDGTPRYRCRECFLQPLVCATCIVTTHCKHPLHFIERWNGRFFVRATLADVGLIIRLGHLGDSCPSIPADKLGKVTSPVTVVHIHGIQNVRIEYCRCALAPSFAQTSHPLQLWSMQLWPSTQDRIRTAFTQQTLRHFQHLSLQSKISAYDYVNTLERLTSNAFRKDVKVCFVYFLLSYRYLHII